MAIELSIIVPVYNAERYICRCVDSLLNQTSIKDLEIILVDDGSTDDSLNICKKYQHDYKSVRVVHKENGGVSSARNIGMDMAHGKYISFVDSDDFCDYKTFEKCLNHLKVTDADILSFGYVIEENGICMQEVMPFNFNDPFVYLKKMHRECWGNVYKCQIIKENNISFDEKISYGEDWIFKLEYLIHTKKVEILSEPLYHYTLDNNGSISRKAIPESFFYSIDRRIADISIVLSNWDVDDKLIQQYLREIRFDNTIKKLISMYRLSKLNSRSTRISFLDTLKTDQEFQNMLYIVDAENRVMSVLMTCLKWKNIKFQDKTIVTLFWAKRTFSRMYRVFLHK